MPRSSRTSSADRYGSEMQKIGGTSNLAAEDLGGYLNCRYLTELDRAIANGELEKPRIRDPALEGVTIRDPPHEQGFIEHFKVGNRHG